MIAGIVAAAAVWPAAASILTLTPTANLSGGEVVPLNDGRALVLRGDPTIYDPITNAFTPIVRPPAPPRTRPLTTTHDQFRISNPQSGPYLKPLLFMRLVAARRDAHPVVQISTRPL